MSLPSLAGKSPEDRKDRRQKGATEDDLVGWHHRLNERKFEQAAGDSEGRGSLACCSPWTQLQRVRHDQASGQQLNPTFKMIEEMWLSSFTEYRTCM